MKAIITLDAGGTNLVFSAIAENGETVVQPITYPSQSKDLDKCLSTMVKGFEEVIEKLPEGYTPAAISFAFPGPADYAAGIIGGYLPNFPSFRNGVALGPFLHEKFGLPVYINNDGDLFALGEATFGILPEINRRLEAAGSPKRYRNLLGYTFGTGFGIGSVVDGRLNRGNNSCVETFCLRHALMPDVIAEEGVAVRAVIREYVEAARKNGHDISKADAEALTPYDIFLIADGKKPGDQQAARQSFATLGRVAGEAMATAVTLTDSLVVIGGGITGAAAYFMPALLEAMRAKIRTLTGDEVPLVQMDVFDLTNPDDFSRFAADNSRPLQVYGTSLSVPYDPVRRTGVALSSLGASRAISLGAASFALAQLEK